MRFSWLLLPLGALTMLPRLAMPDLPVPTDKRAALDAIADILRGHGYATRLEDRKTMDNVRATRGACSLSIAVETSSGVLIDLFGSIQPPDRPTRLVYRGGEAQDLPRLRPAVEFYAQRQFARFGIAMPVAPVVMISADPTCDIDPDLFTRLRTYPAL